MFSVYAEGEGVTCTLDTWQIRGARRRFGVPPRRRNPSNYSRRGREPSAHAPACHPVLLVLHMVRAPLKERTRRGDRTSGRDWSEAGPPLRPMTRHEPQRTHDRDTLSQLAGDLRHPAPQEMRMVEVGLINSLSRRGDGRAVRIPT